MSRRRIPGFDDHRHGVRAERRRGRALGALMPLLAGTIVGDDYEILRPIKEGGMGAVYEARQRSTGRVRALKILLPAIVASPRALERFEREARIGAQIPSAHVVEVLGAGVDATLGAPWIAMEFVQGCELGAFADRAGRLSIEDASEVARQLAHPLSLAHAKGIVHRDLKPENILVGDSRTEGKRFTVKIVDFGIARLRDDPTHGVSASIGTPAWMAPEQADSRAAIDVRADVWSLGLIFFRVLSGKVFWRAAQTDVGSFLRVMHEVCFEPIDLPSRRSEELGGAFLPAGFDAWFARCVDRDPASRFGSAEEALAELGVVLDGARDERELVGRGETVAVDLPRSSLLPLSSRADLTLPGVRQEQAYHLRGFAGRSRLLEQIDAWIDDSSEGASPALLLVGGPGSGKSALAAVIAERREALLHMVKAHKNPLRWMRALATQADLVAGSTRIGPPPGDVDDARAELTTSLERAVAVRRPLVVVVDGLDELDDPLDVAALPPHWPTGTRLLLTARPDHDLLRALRMRLLGVEELRVPPLDPDDVATIARTIRPHATAPEIRDLSARTGGLPLLVRRALEVAGDRMEGARLSLDDVFDDAYRAVAKDPERARILQILVVAREALDAVSVAELRALDGPLVPEPRSVGRALLERTRRALAETSEYLLEIRPSAFVPWHAGFADFIRAQILGVEGVREIEQLFATWTQSTDGRYSRYALRHRTRHLVAAGAWADAARELAEPAFVAASIEAGRVFDLVPELERARSPYAALLRRHAHFLGRHPSALPTLVSDAPRTGPWIERLDVRPSSSDAEVLTLVGHRGEVWGVDVSPDGACLATGSADGSLRLWERSSGRELARLAFPPRRNGKPARVFDLAFAPDGTRLYVAAEGQGLAAVDVATLAFVPWWSDETCWSVAVSRDGARIAAGSRRGEVRVWSHDGALLEERAVGGIVTALAFDGDGSIAVGTEWRRLVVWDLQGNERVREMDLPAPPSALGFVDGSLLAACSDGVVRTWDPSGKRSFDRTFAGDRLHAAAFDGEHVAFAGLRGVVYVASREALASSRDDGLPSARAHSAPIDALALVPSAEAETLVLTGSNDGTARLVRVGAAKHASEEERVTAMAIAPDGATVLSGMHDGTVRVRRSGKPDAIAALRRARIQAFAFSSDGVFAAIACQDGSAVVVRLGALGTDQRAVVAELRAHEAAVNAVAFVPPAGLVATASSDETVAISTLFGGRVVRRFAAAGSVATVAADVLGRRVAAVTRAGDLALWDVAGEGDTRLGGAFPEGAPRSLDLEVDGTLTAVLQDGLVRAFAFRDGALVPIAPRDARAPIVAVSDPTRAETRFQRGGVTIAAYPFTLEPSTVSADGRRSAGWHDGELHVLALREAERHPDQS